MQAICYQVNPMGYATCKWLRHLWRGCLRSRLNGVRLREAPEPELPGDRWVRVRTLLGGICGSDVGVIAQRQPPNSILQAYTSFPAVLGHENLGVVDHVGPAVDRAWLGKRVTVEPTLGCTVRGIAPPCARCEAGEFGACENFSGVAGGSAGLPAGTSIGYNARTGGSFGERFVAHESQLVAVDDGLSDEQAILTDPVACSLHAALRADLERAGRVLVYGAGSLGLGLTASLRAIGYDGHIDALGRAAYLEQPTLALGADEFVRLPSSSRRRFERIAELTGGTVQRARFGNYMLSGGYDVVFDCVGSPRAINESLKWTRARGQVVMVATGHGGVGVDLSPIWFRELHVIGAYGRQVEHFAGRRIGTYQLVQELMAAGKLNVECMLTHTFPLGEYRKAFDLAMNKGPGRAIKVAFDFR